MDGSEEALNAAAVLGVGAFDDEFDDELEMRMLSLAQLASQQGGQAGTAVSVVPETSLGFGAR